MPNTAPKASDTNLEQQLAERQRVMGYISGCTTRDQLVTMAKRLQKPEYEHLVDLVEVCYDRCINEGLLHGNYKSLPDPRPEDMERIDLHRSWLVAIVITNKCSLAVVNSVRGKGYLEAMLNQIRRQEDIGSAGFLRLKEDNALHHSAEYLMRKYYSDRLNEKQVEKIDKLLLENGISV